jgi:hypothetical protein
MGALRSAPLAVARAVGAVRRAGAERRFVLAIGLTAAVPVVVSTVRALAAGWVPVYDDAIIATTGLDALTSHARLVGVYSDASRPEVGPLYNAGPMLFWLLALPARLPRDWAIPVTVGLINSASIVGAVALAHRRGAADRARWQLRRSGSRHGGRSGPRRTDDRGCRAGDQVRDEPMSIRCRRSDPQTVAARHPGGGGRVLDPPGLRSGRPSPGQFGAHPRDGDHGREDRWRRRRLALARTGDRSPAVVAQGSDGCHHPHLRGLWPRPERGRGLHWRHRGGLTLVGLVAVRRRRPHIAVGAPIAVPRAGRPPDRPRPVTVSTYPLRESRR